jgi:DNA polymerase I-like protein with 3'-5' exonuclease and polymerase domains
MAKLSDLCATHLNIPVDKMLQTSDWSGELTDNQLMYAASDAYYTRLLFEKLMSLITEQGSERVYKVCKEAQQAVVDMELAGMPFDAEAHKILLEKLTLERDAYKATLEKTLGKINFNSGKQLGEWIAKLLGGMTSPKFNKWPKTPKGQLATSEKDFRKSMKLLPKAEQALVKDFFLPYKTTEKQITSFGESLLKVISKSTGRIHASFKMAGTKTGRFSCSNPNLQQIPRDKVFRALFKAPEGKTFVIADYSQMELRVAAIVANESKLLEAYDKGQDTHAITAAMLVTTQVPLKSL